MANEKWMWIVTGPNGAGKSNFVNSGDHSLDGLPYLNPDDALKELKTSLHQHNVYPPESKLHERIFESNARKIAEYRKNGESFVVETTTPGITYTRLAEEMKKQGWNIGVVAIGVATPELALNRVGARAAEGGHGKDEQAIRDTWAACARRTPAFLAMADEAVFYDHSGLTFEEIASRKKGEPKLTLKVKETDIHPDNRYAQQILAGLRAQDMLGPPVGRFR